MGYVRDKTYRLKWPADSEFAGLEVAMRPGSIGMMRRAAALKGLRGMTEAEQLEAVGEVIDLMAQALTGWNLEVETRVNGEAVRQPVPATVDGLAAQDHELVFAILEAWMDAQTAVPAPLAARSPDGELSALVRSLPMEPLPASPSSLSTPSSSVG